MKKIGVFIPGRLQSERLPNKLILPLGDTNLWDIACKKLNSLPDKYNKYALCYDKELVEIAQKYENLTVILRDEDTALVDGPLEYIFKDLKEVEDTHLMFLNPCLAFLEKETILKSLETFDSLDEDYCEGNYATSVKVYKNWLFNNENRCLTDINYERLTTKEIPDYYEAAHCFHIFNKDNFFKDGQMLKDNHSLIEVPNKEVIDIDTKEDYEFAKWKWENKSTSPT